MLGFAAASVLLESAKASILNPGPHGLSEVVYAFTSAANNNGSAFGGLTGNTDWYNTTLGLAMLGGRFLLIVTVLALAGSLARKQTVPATAGTFPTGDAALHRAAARGRADRRRPDLLPRPRPRADRGATGAMRAQTALLDPQILRRASVDAMRKLDPRRMARNPVMFVVELGSVLVTVIAVADPSVFAWLIAAWLWFTVLFANLAEAIAEGRGKAQAEALRRTRAETLAHRRRADGTLEDVPSSGLAEGDVVVVAAGELIPADGEVIEGIASVDESAITGESAPVIRESGGDRSAVTGGTRVLSDRIVVRVTQRPGESFLDRMIALVEGSSRQKTPNEIALSILLSGLTIIFLLAVVTLQPFAIYSGARQDTIVLVALLVCLIPTTIGALLSAIGIAGMDRLVRRNVLALSGRAVEAAGDCSTLLLDKTGTITLGNRQAAEFLPLPGVLERELADAAQLSSLADETPEGRSIVVLAKERFQIRERELAGATLIPFTAQTRMSGVDMPGRSIRKGAADAIRRWLGSEDGNEPALATLVDEVALSGGTPLVVAENGHALGVVHLKDVVKEGLRERFDELRAMGIRTVMITGDNPLDGEGDRRRGRGRRLPRRGDARGQDGADQARAGGRQPRRDDRRRHQRCAGARAGRRRRRHEHRHPGGARGREHGRPRLESDEADRDRRDRQATADHPRRADDLLDRERRRQVLRDHPGDVRRRLPGARRAERDGSRQPRVGDPERRRLQRARDRGADPARAARRPLPRRLRRRRASAQPARLRPRRPDRPLRRDQGNRPHRRRAGDRLMRRQILPAIVAFLALTVLTGIAYPLAVTGVSQVAFGDQGERVADRARRPRRRLEPDRTAVRPAARYFQPRPSAAGDGYDAMSSSASNLGPTNPVLLDAVRERLDAYRELNDVAPGTEVPIDAVTSSGSGLDPHISLANARLQAPRVAEARGLDLADVLELIDRHTSGRSLGFLGEPGVNVLELNLALDDRA